MHENVHTTQGNGIDVIWWVLSWYREINYIVHRFCLTRRDHDWKLLRDDTVLTLADLPRVHVTMDQRMDFRKNLELDFPKDVARVDLFSFFDPGLVLLVVLVLSSSADVLRVSRASTDVATSLKEEFGWTYSESPGLVGY